MLEKDYAIKILSFLKAKNKHVFLVWQEDTGLNGDLAKIMDVFDDSALFSVEHKDAISTLSSGKYIFLRTSMLFRPILFSFKSKEKDGVLLKYMGIAPVEKERRRFLRVYLEEPIEGILFVGDTFFPIWIIDISEDGAAGITINANVPLDTLYSKDAELEFNIFDTIIKSRVCFVWISKTSSGQFFAGVEFHLDDAQKDKIKRFITEHIYSIEDQIFDLLRFL